VAVARHSVGITKKAKIIVVVSVVLMGALTTQVAIALNGSTMPVANAEITSGPPQRLLDQLDNCRDMLAVAKTNADKTWANTCIRLANAAIAAATPPTPTPTTTSTQTASPSPTVTPTQTSTPTPTPTTPSPTPTATPTPTPTNTGGIPAGFPNASNTGNIGPLTQMACPSNGSINITTNGFILQNVDIGDCGIDISAQNVTVKNIKAHSSWNDGFLIIVRDGFSATITDSELFGEGLTTTSVEYIVFAPNATVNVQRNNMYHCADCVQSDHAIVKDNFIHDMAFIRGTSHVDGFQCNASCSGTQIIHNTVINHTGDNMGVSLFADFGTPNGVLIDNNFIDLGFTGSYSIWAAGKNHTITNNIVVPGGANDNDPLSNWLGGRPSNSGDIISGNRMPDGTPLN